MNEVTWANPESLDLLGATSILSMPPMVRVYNGLIKEDPQQRGRIVPDLAERWTTSDDGTRLTFILRKGVAFHDGRPVTATDAKFSVERWVKDNPSVAPALAPVIQSVEAPDAATLVINLKSPYPDIFKLLQMQFLAVTPAGSRPTTVQQVVGTGPFKLKSYQRDVSYAALKNESYWNKGFPYLDGINTYIISDRSTGLAAFRAGRIEMVGTAYLQLPQYLTISTAMKDQATAYVYPNTRWWTFYLPVNKKPWSDVRVRRAVFMAIDRAQANSTLGRGLGTIEGVVPTGMGGLPQAELQKTPGWREPRSMDIDEAKRLLAQAGFPNGFDTDIYHKQGSDYVAFATFLKDQLNKLSIRATLSTRPAPAFWDFLYSRSYDTYADSHLLAPAIADNVLAYYRSGEDRNFASIADSKLDAMIAQQQRTLDPDQRARQLRAIETYLYDNALTGVVYWAGYFQAWQNRVRDYVPGETMYGDIRYEAVWLDK